MPDTDAAPETTAEKTAYNAKLKALRLLKYKDRSTLELQSRLKDAGFDDSAVQAAIDYCRDKGFLDDTRFASAYIHSKIASGWGRNRIALELNRRGIEMTSLKGYPDEYFEVNETERALSVLEHHRLPDRDIKIKSYRYLISKGYSHDAAYNAAHLFAEQCNSVGNSLG